VRKGRLEVGRNFFGMREVTVWNKISTNLKAIKGAAKFRATYKKMRDPIWIA
jgi:hypothetical protein